MVGRHRAVELLVPESRVHRVNVLGLFGRGHCKEMGACGFDVGRADTACLASSESKTKSSLPMGLTIHGCSFAAPVTKLGRLYRLGETESIANSDPWQTVCFNPPGRESVERHLGWKPVLRSMQSSELVPVTRLPPPGLPFSTPKSGIATIKGFAQDVTAASRKPVGQSLDSLATQSSQPLLQAGGDQQKHSAPCVASCARIGRHRSGKKTGEIKHHQTPD